MRSPWPIRVVSLEPISCGAALWHSAQGPLSITVIVKATFEMVNGRDARPAPPLPLARKDTPGERASFGVHDVSDLAPYLPSAGVMLSGHAYAPPDKHATTMPARLGIFRGDWLLDKTVHVHGDRSSPAANPQPFQRMPIVHERAYGGSSVDRNPAGTGAVLGSPTPNVLDPVDPRKPTGFGPIPSRWRARARLLGGLDPAKLGPPVAEVPAGFDWKYFHAAPPDQQIGYLHGDEWIVLEGMHRELPRFATRLPSAKGQARWHVVTEGGASAGHPVELVADTLIIDADRELCAVVWRGSFPVDPTVGLQALRVFTGVELPGDPVLWPAPEDILAAPPAAEAPSSSRPLRVTLGQTNPLNAEQNDVAAARPSSPFSPRVVAPHEGLLEPALDVAASLAPLPPPRTPPRARPVPPPSVPPPARPASAPERPPGPSSRPAAAPDEETRTLSIAEIMERGRKPIAPFDLAPAGGAPRAPLRAIPGAPWSRPDSTPPPAAAEPDASPPPRFVAPAVDAEDRTAHAFPMPAPRALPFDDASDAPDALDALDLEDDDTPASPGEILDALASVPAPAVAPHEAEDAAPTEPPATRASLPACDIDDPATVVADSEAPPAAEHDARAIDEADRAIAPPDAPAMDEPALADIAADPVRVAVIERLRAGESLHDLTLAGADLHGLDLRGLSLSGAKLAKANLAGARLEGARLADARLEGADLQGADLTRADLTRADLTRANLAGARVDEATLTETTFASAIGKGASFRDARGRRTTFARGTWDGAVFAGLDAVGADFSGATLTGASFEGASMPEVRLEDARGSDVVFDRARMADARAQGAELVRSSFQAASAERSTWDKATLNESSFVEANLAGASLLRVACAKARFDGANLAGANLQHVRGDGASFRDANLEGADLRQARFVEACFDSANLKRTLANKADLSRSRFVLADLSGASLRPAKLREANLSRARLDGADLRDADLEQARVCGASRATAKMSGANVKGLIETEALDDGATELTS